MGRNLRSEYIANTEQFLAVSLAAEKILPSRGTSRNLPAAQRVSATHRDARHAQARKPGGKALRTLRALLGGGL